MVFLPALSGRTAIHSSKWNKATAGVRLPMTRGRLPPRVPVAVRVPPTHVESDEICAKESRGPRRGALCGAPFAGGGYAEQGRVPGTCAGLPEPPQDAAAHARYTAPSTARRDASSTRYCGHRGARAADESATHNAGDKTLEPKDRFESIAGCIHKHTMRVGIECCHASEMLCSAHPSTSGRPAAGRRRPI